MIGKFPLPKTEKTLHYSASVLQDSSVDLSVLKNLEVRLLYPKQVWAGETAAIQLKLFNHNRLPATGEGIPQTVVLQSRLEMAGVELSPNGLQSVSIQEEGFSRLVWNLAVPQTGKETGTCWIFLLQKKGENPEMIPLFAVPLEVESIEFFGIPNRYFIWMGGIFFVPGILIAFQELLDLLDARSNLKRLSG